MTNTLLLGQFLSNSGASHLSEASRIFCSRAMLRRFSQTERQLSLFAAVKIKRETPNSNHKIGASIPGHIIFPEHIPANESKMQAD